MVDVIILGSKKPYGAVMYHFRELTRGRVQIAIAPEYLGFEYESVRNDITYAVRGDVKLASKFMTQDGLKAWQNE